MATAYIQKAKAEHVRRMESSKRKTLDKFVELKSGEITRVDWRGLVTAHQEFVEKASEGIDDPTWIDMFRYLEAKERLCSDDQGFFPFNGIDLSPNAGGIKYHFTRKSDATAYIQAQFAKALYPVRIAKVVTERAVNK
jgi:hypothetical protein